MDENEFSEVLKALLEDSDELPDLVAEIVGEDEAEEAGNLRVKTFEDAMLMTNNAGLVVRIGDAEFQITIVRSR